MNADGREGFAAFVLRMRAAGVADKALLEAVEAIPRASFVPAQWQDAVWSRRMIPIDCGETIEGLDLQARALAALGPAPGHRVLEIGTGSGYSAALLARLATRVISLERYRRLVDQARLRLEPLGLTNIFVRHADGSAGLAAEGPFDRIICWAAFGEHPRQFTEQLATNGVMVCAIGPTDGVQQLVRLKKLGSRFEKEELEPVRLQPLLPGIAAAI